MRRLALLLVPFTLLLASCGSDGPSAQEVVARAPRATLEASTARLRTTLTFPGDATRLDIDGAVDFTRGRSAMALHLRGGVDATAEARQAGTAVYLRLPAGADLLPGLAAGDWMQLDLSHAADGTGLQLGLDSNDPREPLALLAGVAPDGARRMGDEDVDSVPTTRYRAAIDVDRVLRARGVGVDPGVLRRFVDRIGPHRLVVTAWIDHDGRVRRIRVPLPDVTITTDFRDFGARVDVAPPTEHVVDVSHRLAELLPDGG